MNIVLTVADLKKALSAYEDDLPIEIVSEVGRFTFGTDLAFCKHTHANNAPTFRIDLGEPK